MKKAWLVPISTFLWLILSFMISCQHHTQGAQVPESLSVKTSAEPHQGPTGPAVVAKNPLPEISFEKTVFDLGDVGQGTKNTCEFRFTNTARGLLKIGKISRTCGCTVFQLDKKEYAPNETGTIKIIYTAGKSTVSTQKSIYVPTNDKDSPRVNLKITGRLTGGTPFEAKDSIRVINKNSLKSAN